MHEEFVTYDIYGELIAYPIKREDEGEEEYMDRCYRIIRVVSHE